LDPLPLKGAAASLHWDAPQYIQADAQGKVFLLRGDTLEVYPVTKAHDLGEPVRLELGVRSGIPLDAAISPDGSWVVNMGAQVHWFVDGKEKSLPALRSSPVSVGFLRGDPVAMVVPRHGEAQDDDRRGPPLLLRAGHDAWSPELREVLHATPLDLSTERAYRSALVLDERDGRYFMARQFAYRIDLRRLGRDHPIEELRLGGDEPILSKPVAGEEQRLLAQARAQGTDVAGGKISVFHGVAAIRALARGGPEGRLYALLGPGIAGDHCALDRIAWSERRVERLPLNLPCAGRVSLAVGRDGLYFAEFNGEGGRYFVSWNALDAAKWSTVKEAAFTP
jgi:hypothetical protein